MNGKSRCSPGGNTRACTPTSNRMATTRPSGSVRPKYRRSIIPTCWPPTLISMPPAKTKMMTSRMKAPMAMMGTIMAGFLSMHPDQLRSLIFVPRRYHRLGASTSTNEERREKGGCEPLQALSNERVYGELVVGDGLREDELFAVVDDFRLSLVVQLQARTQPGKEEDCAQVVLGLEEIGLAADQFDVRIGRPPHDVGIVAATQRFVRLRHRVAQRGVLDAISFSRHAIWSPGEEPEAL